MKTTKLNTFEKSQITHFSQTDLNKNILKLKNKGNQIMKALAFLTILLIFNLINLMNLFAQSGWQSQTSGTSDNLYDVHFISSSIGWAVGNGGTILTTTSGGENWTSQSSGTTNPLNSVYFITPLNGWAVGGFGLGELILKTTNGGDNWFSQSSGSTGPLFSVHFISPLTGWAVGSSGLGPLFTKIIKTTNGGTNWVTQSSGASAPLFDVFFRTPSSIGWAVGHIGTILKTGGTVWTSQTSGTTATLYSVFFTSSSIGWAVGANGTILKTTDGGTNWIPQTSGTIAGLESVHFSSSLTGWAVGGITILNTTNAGTNWTSQSSGTSNSLSSVYFTSTLTGWAVGANGTILKTTTGGIASYNLNLSALIEGFYDENSGYMKEDTVNVYLRNSASPYSLVDSAKKYLDSSGHCTLSFYNAANATPYYIVIKHRNSIETWSGSAMSFSSNSLTYDFTTSASQAYGNNMVLKGTEYCIYSGDVNQDSTVDLTDISSVYNDASNFVTGYNVTDVTGDNITDLSDLVITYTNSSNFVQKITPLGPGPLSPNTSHDTKEIQASIEQPKNNNKDKTNINKNMK